MPTALTSRKILAKEWKWKQAKGEDSPSSVSQSINSRVFSDIYSVFFKQLRSCNWSPFNSFCSLNHNFPLLVEGRWHHSTGNAFLTQQERETLPRPDPRLCFHLIALSDWPCVCAWLVFMSVWAQASAQPLSYNAKWIPSQNTGQSRVKPKNSLKVTPKISMPRNEKNVMSLTGPDFYGG